MPGDCKLVVIIYGLKIRETGNVSKNWSKQKYIRPKNIYACLRLPDLPYFVSQKCLP